MRTRLLLLALSMPLMAPSPSDAAVARKPNVLILLRDDVGWGEYGFQAGKDIPTPPIESIAKNGVRCARGYLSGPYRSPTRAGLMTGRYKTRFGHENNNGPRVSCLPLTETTFADRLRAEGYATCAVGKWHLGGGPEY
ncbi:MAG: sulfatase-like hydrolase/transferase, partial [Planctomycetia bacterium]|nr:sulfatase-like hydrolase/transferase [Planctomycetia bacterium]